MLSAPILTLSINAANSHGIEWEEVITDVQIPSCIGYADGTYICGAPMRRSNDLVNWTLCRDKSNNVVDFFPNFITKLQGYWFAMILSSSYDSTTTGSSTIWVSADDGITWESQSLGNVNYKPTSIHFTGSNFMITSSYGRIIYSAMPSVGKLPSWSNNGSIAINNYAINGQVTIYSAKTPYITYGYIPTTNVTTGQSLKSNCRYVATGSNYLVAGTQSHGLAYSTVNNPVNGTWTYNSSITGVVNKIYYYNNTWYVTELNNKKLYYSKDLSTNFSSVTLPFYPDIFTYNQGIYIGGSTNYNDPGIYYSLNGIDWKLSNITDTTMAQVPIRTSDGQWLVCTGSTHKLLKS